MNKAGVAKKVDAAGLKPAAVRRVGASPTLGTNTTGPDQFGPDSGLDAGIVRYVNLLRRHGIETFESCQGGDGHAFAEPTVRFHGAHYEGCRALSVAHMYGLPVRQLNRYWQVYDGELHGPQWALVFSAADSGDQRLRAEAAEAKVDSLMLEYCPDEMTPEQMANWAAHQRRAAPEHEAALEAALARPA